MEVFKKRAVEISRWSLNYRRSKGENQESSSRYVMMGWPHHLSPIHNWI